MSQVVTLQGLPFYIFDCFGFLQRYRCFLATDPQIHKARTFPLLKFHYYYVIIQCTDKKSICLALFWGECKNLSTWAAEIK